MENKINPVDGQLTIIDAEGNEKLCQILFTLDSEEFGKKFVVFYPMEQLEEEGSDDDEIQLMAASYVEGADGVGELFEIESDEEWDLIESAVSDYEDSLDEEECECGEHCHHEHEDSEHKCCHHEHEDGEHNCCHHHKKEE